VTPRLFIFGLGYSAQAIAGTFAAHGWDVVSTGRAGTLRFADAGTVRLALADASHVLSSVPPDGAGGDPVLESYGDALAGKWLGYLSSTGVYGDSGGAWVDESAATGGGRKPARAECDALWLARGARVFRLPGIYGPGRSAFERLASGAARRIDRPRQIFSRIHVEDIASAVWAAVARDAPAGAYNLADAEPAHPNAVIEEACRLAGLPLPPLVSPDDPSVPAIARGFYEGSRRVAAGKARRVLGWAPRWASYREGLRALLPVSAISKPDSASPAPATASVDQR
jgi:nucleoside-diphosphate-sugar epimerase